MIIFANQTPIFMQILLLILVCASIIMDVAVILLLFKIRNLGLLHFNYIRDLLYDIIRSFPWEKEARNTRKRTNNSND